MNKHKSVVLDPLCVICKFALLSFYENGTKITLKENIILLEKPYNLSAMQYLYRRINGVGKDDFVYVFRAFVRFIKLYLVETEESKKIFFQDNKNQESNESKKIDEKTEYKKTDDLVNNKKKNKNNNKEHQEDNKRTDNDYTDGNKKESCEIKDIDKNDIKKSNISNESKKIDNKRNLFRHEAIKRIAKYACSGLEKLQNTYGEDNISNSAQLTILCLEHALDNKYTDKLLPTTYRNKYEKTPIIINEANIVNIWDEKRIDKIIELLDRCRDSLDERKQKLIDDAHTTNIINGYINSLNNILEEMDNNFTKIIAF